MNPSALLLLITFSAVFVVFALFGAAALRLSPSRLSGDEISAIVVPLVAIGLAGNAAFYVFLFSPLLGKLFATAALAGCFFVIVRPRRTSAPSWPADIATAAMLMAAFGLIYLGALFAPQFGQPYADQSAVRFTHRLPFDSVIPAFIGNRLFAGQSLRPFVGDWLSSDRPPLQAGIYLLVLPWMKMLGLPIGLGYQCAGTILQIFWLPAAWVLCRAFGLSRMAAALVICVVGSTGFFLLNSVFVWPKLLAAAYAVSSGVLLLDSRREAADCRSQRHAPPSLCYHMGRLRSHCSPSRRSGCCVKKCGRLGDH